MKTSPKIAPFTTFGFYYQPDDSRDPAEAIIAIIYQVSMSIWSAKTAAKTRITAISLT